MARLDAEDRQELAHLGGLKDHQLLRLRELFPENVEVLTAVCRELELRRNYQEYKAVREAALVRRRYKQPVG